MNFKEAYRCLNGQEPTADNVLRFERLVATLETTPGDALLAVLVALEHYQTLYAAIPARISQASNDTLIDFKTAADKTVKAAAAAATADLAAAVADAAQEVANNTSRKQMWQWASACLAVAFLSVGMFGWYMHSTGKHAGYSAGYGAGYEKAKDEKAAAAWANTPEGKTAYRLAQAGSIGNLARCNQPGWYVKDGSCFVEAAPNKNIYGWRVR